MEIIPINEYILVEKDTTEEKTDSGLVLPQDPGARTESVGIRATVIASDIPHEKQLVEVGDKVLVPRWEVINHAANGKQYMLVKQKDILALLK